MAALLLMAGCSAGGAGQQAAQRQRAPGAGPAGDVTASDAPVQTDFEERYRPQYHYSPRQNWMNDPNGLVYYEGQYHLFHQYNPQGTTWGHMSWAHATSEDLVHWQHQPVAIREEGDEMIFSGSAVVDKKNTSGFGEEGGEPPIVAIYTSHYDRPASEAGFDQAQSLAYSPDGGETWTKYAGNPVLEGTPPDFRDPKVFRYARGEDEAKWVMIVAIPKKRQVQLYESQNLKDWSLMSTFGPAGATGGIWECPDLFELPVKGHADSTRWVLEVDLNPGSVAGGSGGQYFVGDFDGTSFTEDPEAREEGEALWVDYGPDFYAAITWNNVPSDRRLWVGWMNNWSYAEKIPTSPWRSAQSVPRRLALRTVEGAPRMVQTPVEELEQLRREHQHLENRTVASGERSLREGVAGKALEIDALLDVGEAARAGLEVRAGAEQETVVGYDAEAGEVYLDRTDAGVDSFSTDFPARMTAPLSAPDGEVRLRILVDWSSVEVFAAGGARVLTARVFPNPQSQDVRFFAEGGEATLTAMDAWQMASVWERGD